MARRKPLAFMGDNEWINVPTGEEEFTYEKKIRQQVGTGPKGGKIFQTRTITVTSRERHAKNTVTGEKISVRQYQNLQRTNRASLGVSKPPSVPRRQKTRTKYNLTGTGKEFWGIYDAQKHGNGQIIYFYTLQDARNWVIQNKLPEQFKNVVLGFKYDARLVKGPAKTGSDPTNKPGYATITPFRTAKTFNITSDYTTPNQIGEVENPWFTAEKALARYTMGPDSRVYLLMTER